MQQDEIWGASAATVEPKEANMLQLNSYSICVNTLQFAKDSSKLMSRYLYFATNIRSSVIQNNKQKTVSSSLSVTVVPHGFSLLPLLVLYIWTVSSAFCS